MPRTKARWTHRKGCRKTRNADDAAVAVAADPAEEPGVHRKGCRKTRNADDAAVAVAADPAEKPGVLVEVSVMPRGKGLTHKKTPQHSIDDDVVMAVAAAPAEAAGANVEVTLAVAAAEANTNWNFITADSDDDVAVAVAAAPAEAVEVTVAVTDSDDGDDGNEPFEEFEEEKNTSSLSFYDSDDVDDDSGDNEVRQASAQLSTVPDRLESPGPPVTSTRSSRYYGPRYWGPPPDEGIFDANGNVIIRRPWTTDETNALLWGIEKCGVGKWVQVKNETGEALKNRSTIQLKEKHRTMKNQGTFPVNR
jgi:hypothetical protein